MFTAPKSYRFSTEAETAAFAQQLAPLLRPGDVLLLSGEIGAGKSAFARAIIRALADAEIDVPSPTFTLVQTYELPSGDVWHCDLYRLTHQDEALELGLDEAFETAICLIEWPDRLGADAPDKALQLHFAAESDHHSLALNAPDNWASRLAAAHV